MDETAPEKKPESSGRKWGDVALAVLLTMGYGSPLIGALVAAIVALADSKIISAIAVPLAIVAWSAVFIATRRSIRRGNRARFMVTGEVLVLILLPAWGLAYSHWARAECTISTCDAGTTAFRPLAEPELYGLLALHAATALAYVVSRRRPAALRPPTEILVHAALLVGIALHALAAIHFGSWILAGLIVEPLFVPCLAPVFTVILFAVELRGRLVRRGIEAQERALERVDSVYREGPPQVLLPPVPAMHGPTLRRALALSPVLLGLYAIAHAVWLGHTAGALQVFTRTCGYTLSQLPIVEIPQDCHYLCTVAARGHSWLVRPLRLGRRGGIAITVNRQLAIANAFEDLLHEYWPRFGAAARRLYDRLGLPVSRYIRSRWAADLVYLAMKPLEWGFFLVLLLLDRGAPEERIDRMYR